MVKATLGVLLGLFLALSGLASYVFFPTILKTQVELARCFRALGACALATAAVLCRC
ncbi:hypothetical protein IscW_ISCW008058 [Ixodes scapularis]|uniref:Uncharacterized protein n=1 Tax=Ixodes scapularis TaxID=6945 RepID=B7PSP5_IXOSC|nr:hypothetical protein IscW_ISCW008058 [Ixodes scapularis]|eukprot:XP_002402805.1 hypothetical protein IscW_ISCW008058 [Ixodes scapularis]